MIKLLLFLLLLATALSQGGAEVFHVTPDTSATHLRCPPPCYTLDQYASNHSLLEGHTNITLIFLRGEHTLNHSLLVSGVDELSMQAQETAINDSEVVIIFQPGVPTHLKNCSILTIENITLRYPLVTTGTRRQQFEIIIDSIQRIVLYGLTLDTVKLAIGQTHSIYVNECNGSQSTLEFSDVVTIDVTNTSLSGGHELLARHNGINIISQGKDKNTSLTIQNSYFMNYFPVVGINSAVSRMKMSIINTQFVGMYFAISFVFKQWGELMITTNTTFEGGYYGVLAVTMPEDNGILAEGDIRREIIINDSKFEDILIGVYIVPRYGADITVNISNTCMIGNEYGVYAIPSLASFVLSIHNSTISHSSTLGMLIVNANSVSITNSTFDNNQIGIVSVGSALYIQDSVISNNSFGLFIPSGDLIEGQVLERATLIQYSNFSSNSLSGMILLNAPGNVILEGCRFYTNKGTPLVAYQSTFELMGETIFRDNTADRGGGLALYSSTVTFGPGSNTQFINNTALEYGGAIYIVSLPTILPELVIDIESFTESIGLPYNVRNIDFFKTQCFFANSAPHTPRVSFIGNNATLGGLDIYGPTLYTTDCSIIGNDVFMFSGSKQPNSLRIASDPSRVCFCRNDIPQCYNSVPFLVMNDTRFPGETFSVPVVLTGYNFGRVAGFVYTNIVGQESTNLVLDENQDAQQVTLQTCTDLTYNIKLLEETNHNSSITVTLALTAQNQIAPKSQNASLSDLDLCNDKFPPCTALLTTPVYIDVTLEKCPRGFDLNETNGVCDCDEIIDSFTHHDGTSLTCQIRDRVGYVSRKGTVWIGVDTNQNNNSSNLYYRYRSCPRDYCTSSKVEVDLRNPDDQCERNRGGLLCGSCHGNYSLQLGSNNCEECYNNDRIFLLIAFAILGILLVVLITTLDLTVASGTINGLIFYANVVWRNKEVLLSSQNRNTTEEYYQVITVPIAWINLDFGIETCFSESLDQLGKTGLQFVFPVYIWCITLFIIIISHYSTRATKLFGNNSVAVLATLLLLSYGKLFKNVTDVFNYADLKGSNNEPKLVWYLDGNIEYGNSGWHIVLILVALLFSIFFLLPFTLLLLLVPFLRAKSNLRLLRWINKLIPFFDTYTGPFKHKKRYQVWTGILLMARVVTLIAFAAIPTDNSDLNIFVMIITATFLLVYILVVGFLYNKFYVHLLEVSYLMNLLLLGGAYLFFQTPDFIIVSIIIVWIVLLQFAGTLIFHTVRRILSIKRIRALFKREPKQVELGISSQEKEPSIQVINASEIYDSSRLRESLLL